MAASGARVNMAIGRGRRRPEGRGGRRAWTSAVELVQTWIKGAAPKARSPTQAGAALAT